MAFAGISYVAILVAAVAAWVFGAAYYMALSRPWMAAAGLSKDMIAPQGKGPSPLPFILSFIGELVMAFVLAGAIGHLGPGQVTLRNGLISGTILWAGFILTTTIITNSYQRKPWSLSLIDSLHWLGVMLVMGAIIGGFGA
ncbi:DUF1761 domain-containing protein [Candidatus Raskinella chloraquaticus]|uniref:DUF1761 domain-containing protein n=1 Tax=Candidatus Raskinella chloraquaticus TaxID=1951219 RepID=A0A1W9HYR9_9HYPH|nr:MAG: hypothetical protein A4S15_07035 [Proteobacteria bacterium SG_bin8]